MGKDARPDDDQTVAAPAAGAGQSSFQATVLDLAQARMDGREHVRRAGTAAVSALPPASEAARPVRCAILTYCRRLDLLYGSTLIFKTLRVGFPTAAVTVVDNASLPEARPEIERAARDAGCAFVQLPAPGVQHHDFLEDALRAAAGESTPFVFLDPDVCFWQSCEDLKFDGLMAGRFFGAFSTPTTKTLTVPRLHTSFLWISDPKRLWDEIRAIRSTLHYDFDPFRCFSIKIGGQWFRYDTGAALYAVFGDRAVSFTEEHLNRYDHLFCGCHLDWVEPILDPDSLATVRQIHADAKAGNLEGLKGIWRAQDELGRPKRPKATVAVGTRA